MSKEVLVTPDPARSSLARAAFDFHTEIAKLEQRIARIEQPGSSPSAPVSKVPYVALLVSIISLLFSGYNVWVASQTEGNLVLQYIEQIAPLRPASEVTSGTQAVASGTEYLTYDSKAQQIQNLLSASTDKSVSATAYVSLIHSALLFRDKTRTKVFLAHSDNAGTEWSLAFWKHSDSKLEPDSKTQLALQWAEQASAFHDPQDVQPAIDHLSPLLTTIESSTDEKVLYQTHYDLASLYSLDGPGRKLSEAAVNLKSAQDALNALSQSGTAENKDFATKFQVQLTELKGKVDALTIKPKILGGRTVGTPPTK